ncbi:hypothetical protein B0H21DRAFT_712151 [Amylocystis lapponica]|nr:hypothetical protein B0H21DRAFT_712151 [Amylocystis lapponica]
MSRWILDSQAIIPGSTTLPKMRTGRYQFVQYDGSQVFGTTTDDYANNSDDDSMSDDAKQDMIDEALIEEQMRGTTVPGSFSVDGFTQVVQHMPVAHNFIYDGHLQGQVPGLQQSALLQPSEIDVRHDRENRARSEPPFPPERLLPVRQRIESDRSRSVTPSMASIPEDALPSSQRINRHPEIQGAEYFIPPPQHLGPDAAPAPSPNVPFFANAGNLRPPRNYAPPGTNTELSQTAFSADPAMNSFLHHIAQMVRIEMAQEFSSMFAKQEEWVAQLQPLMTLVPGRARRVRQPRDPTGYDANEEGEFVNLRQEQFRKYLYGKGVYPQKGSPFPPSPTAQVINAWVQSVGVGPDIAAPQIDWENKMSLPWNQEMIHLLATEFWAAVEAGKHPPLEADPVEKPVEYYAAKCQEKLEDRRHQYIQECSMQEDKLAGERAVEKAQCRRNSRRNTTFRCCNTIIDANLTDNRDVWDKVKAVIDVLGPGGMSSDETDVNVSTSRQKSLRRIRLPWCSREVEALPARSDLPVTYYDTQYRRGLAGAMRMKLRMCAPEEIPKLNEYRA